MEDRERPPPRGMRTETERAEKKKVDGEKEGEGTLQREQNRYREWER